MSIEDEVGLLTALVSAADLVDVCRKCFRRLEPAGRVGR
jgi:hypothetical protein